MLKKLEELLNNIFTFTVKNSLATCLITFLTVVFCLFKIIPNIQIQFDLASLANNQDSISQKNILKNFTRDSMQTILHISHDKKLSEANLCEIKKATKESGYNNRITNTKGIFNLSLPNESNNRLSFPKLLKLNCDSPDINKYPLKDISHYKSVKDYISEDQKSLTFVIEFNETRWGSKKNLAKKIIEIEQWYKKELPRYHTFTFGPSTLILYINQILKKDFWINILLLIIFFPLFFFVFKSIKGAFVQIIILGISGVLLSAFFPVLNISFTPLNSSLFIILCIASIEDFLFVSFHRQENSSLNYQESFRKFLLPGFFTSLTTIIGFGSLTLSNITSIKEFGLLALIGAIIEWISIFLIAPSLMKQFPTYQNWVNSNDNNVIGSIFAKLVKIRIPRFIGIILLIPFLFITFFINKLEVNDSSLNFFKENHPIHKNKETLFQARNWNSLFFISMSHSKKDEVAALKDELLKDKNVVKILSYYDLHDEMTASLSTYAKKYVETNSKYSSELSSLVNDKNFVITVYLKSSDLKGASKAIEKAKAECLAYQCDVFGRNVIYHNYTREVLKTFHNSFIISITLITLVILLLSYLCYQTINFPIILSALWGPTVIIGVFYFSAIPLNFITCIFISVLIGVSGDNAIQYLLFNKKEELATTLPKIGTPSFYVALWSISGSLCFYFSESNFTRSLGIIFSLGFFFSLIGDYYILRSLLSTKE